jgi:basic amino acid/polyamine antiporter, APA family
MKKGNMGVSPRQQDETVPEIDTDKGLRRQFGGITATALVVANMIGAGIFTTSGILAGQLPSPGWVLACWIIGGLIAISGALCYAELATRMPREGGEYLYLKRLFHPSLGFLTGWTSFFVGFSAPIGLSALGFAAYLFAGLQRLQIIQVENSGYEILFRKGVAIILITLFTGLHYLGGRLGPRVQNLLTVVKILLIVGLASIGLFIGAGSWVNLAVPATTKPFSFMFFGTAMMMVMFSYSGWNASAYIAGELKDPRKTLPVSMVAGTAVVILLYLFLNLFYFHAVPYSQLAGTVTVAEKALANAFGSGLTDILGAVIGVVLLSSLSAYIMIGPRVYFAMARDGLFFPFAGRVHPRHNVPGDAIIIQGVIAALMVLLGTFEQLLVYVGFALGIFPWLAVVGLFKARKLGIGEERAAKVWGFPLVPLFFLSANLLLMIVAYINRPLESSAAVITVLIGIPCYYLWQKIEGNKKSREIKKVEEAR